MVRKVKRDDVARKKEVFRAALALAGKRQQDVAALLDVTPEHLSQVLSGKRESGKLWRRLDQWTAATIAQHADRIDSAQSAA